MKVVKVLSLGIIILLLIEFTAQLAITYPLAAAYGNWEQHLLPQKIKTMTWFDNGYEYHPYLSYYHKNSIDLLEPTSSVSTEVRIGILGGSVAWNFATYLKSKVGKIELGNLLSEYNLAVQLKVFNISAGGYRQPQQLLASILFGEQVDFFVSIEGFNELTSNGIPCKPYAWNRQSLRFSPSQTGWKDRLVKIGKGTFLNMNYLAQYNIATAKLLLYMTGTAIHNSMRRIEYQKHDGLKETCKGQEHPETETTRVNRWIKDVEKHQQIVSSFGKKLITIMQPNQYDQGSKKWSKNEEIIFNHASYIKPLVEKTYPIARKRFNNLALKNSRLVDFTKVFQNEVGDIYSDDCCHINERGNKILLQSLKPHILNLLQAHLSKESDTK